MPKVQPIPEGYPQLTPYICVDGADRAIEFYKKVFGAKERMRMPSPGGKIGHAELQIGDSVLMLSDAMGALNTVLVEVLPEIEPIIIRAYARDSE